jgi:hypothetical protein
MTARSESRMRVELGMRWPIWLAWQGNLICKHYSGLHGCSCACTQVDISVRLFASSTLVGPLRYVTARRGLRPVFRHTQTYGEIGSFRVDAS